MSTAIRICIFGCSTAFAIMSVVPAMMAVVVFDAPGTENSIPHHIIYGGMVSTPFTCLTAAIAACSRTSDPRLMAAPLVSIGMVVFGYSIIKILKKV